MLSSSESDSEVVSEDDEEGKIYQLIYEMTNTDNKEEKEEVQIPSSPGNRPVYLNIDAETHAAVNNNPKGLDMDVLDNIQGIPVLETKTSEKPWRKAGADITDYFNYGFDENSWNTYCRKQAKVRLDSRRQLAKLMFQAGYARRVAEGYCSAYSSLGIPSISSRQPSATTDVIGGSGSRAEGRQCLGDEGNTSQVATETSPEEDIFTSYDSPSSSNSLFPFIPPPRVPSLIPRGMVSSAGLINTAKAWESYMWQGKRDKERGRSREHGRDDKDSNRGRDRESGEEQMRHRDSAERGHKRHSHNKFRGEKEEQHGERRHRDTSGDCQKPSCSSSSSKADGGEDKDSQTKHKKKKAKKKKKKKKTNKMLPADQERESKCD